MAGDRRPNLKAKIAQVSEQSEFNNSDSLVAAGHREPYMLNKRSKK